MKISIEANGNKFDFRMTRPDKTAIDSLCRIIRAQAPDRKVAAKPTKRAAKKRKYTHWDVYLANLGPSKINVIKAIRVITGLGLKEAKDMSETPNAKLAKGADEHQVKVWRDALEKECGATLRLKGIG